MKGYLYQIRNIETNDVYVGSSFNPDNHIYYGCAEAARALKCTPGNITYKLKSTKYPNYQYLNKAEIKNHLFTKKEK